MGPHHIIDDIKFFFNVKKINVQVTSMFLNKQKKYETQVISLTELNKLS